MENQSMLEEIDIKLQQLEKPSQFLNEIQSSHRFKESNFKVLLKLIDIEQELKYHPEGNVWNHICMVVDYASIAKRFTYNKSAFMWGSLLHDLGKINTTVKRKGRWTSYNHDNVGYDMVKTLLDKESSDLEFNEQVCELVKFHMHHIYILKNLPFGNINDLINTNNINDIVLLFACDKLGRGNQNSEDKIRIFDEIIKILEIIEMKSGKTYDEVRDNVMKFRSCII